mmetsp:Transcript_4049/g.4680  ORF Transcript_4049/g.4680 Transcript_4049/m.4680 type:complete len:300 (-) Transcript_4049:995-1894(-)|eukprot:CAMPEP_0184027364 /NCGR_PEP_ID=MMETSP0954-20121128/14144_1 /TAXON_ID=627963 /ORGANISM="Aplanochytrium sp, Strain PBS07" /LENGTH=299 /DNA_ID=CAMNT_0026311889 /DNA_START=121 /DNA_END=1020 /DNA_ORIENTATION=-
MVNYGSLSPQSAMKNIFKWKSRKGGGGGPTIAGYKTQPARRPRPKQEDLSEFERKLEVIANRIAEWPKALDGLVFLLKLLLENPNNPKYEQVNTTKKAFKSSIGLCGHWGPDLLELLGFHKQGDLYKIRPGRKDPVRLMMGKTKLETLKTSELYLFGKQKIVFEKEVAEAIKDSSAEEKRRRVEFSLSVPVEPPEGSAGTTSVRVYLGSADVRRNFQSDHTLRGVVSWLASTLTSSVPERLDEGDWELVDRSYYPPKLVNVHESYDSTLQALGIWPSGEIEIQASGVHETERRLNGVAE